MLNHLILIGLKFQQTLKIAFTGIKPTTDHDELDKDAEVRMNTITRKTYKVKTAYFTSKPLAITNENEIKEKVQLTV